MRYLILSDIHANRAALEAVLSKAKGSYDSILNCGDTVGYGPDPNYAAEFARAECLHVIRGNHDKAAVGLADLEWFNPMARTSAEWTQTELTRENA
ncbi:MAG: metallophosphoesterase family protein, partial [Bryobacteraceae bacterium]|nr:metallophosphoesterase family protein [Bryobacteraceae bacterium]